MTSQQLAVKDCRFRNEKPVGQKGFGMQYHNHKDVKTRIKTGFGGYFDGWRGFEPMVTIP